MNILRVRFWGESKNGFVIFEHTDSSLLKKLKLRFSNGIHSLGW